MTDSKTSSWRFFFSLPLAQRIAITLWITLFIALSVKTILKPTSHSVFPVYFQAGINWWQQVDVYQVNQGLDHYRYSPTAAIFFSAFTFMGITLGAILWSFARSLFLFWAVTASEKPCSFMVPQSTRTGAAFLSSVFLQHLVAYGTPNATLLLSA